MGKKIGFQMKHNKLNLSRVCGWAVHAGLANHRVQVVCKAFLSHICDVLACPCARSLWWRNEVLATHTCKLLNPVWSFKFVLALPPCVLAESHFVVWNGSLYKMNPKSRPSVDLPWVAVYFKVAIYLGLKLCKIT